MATSTTNEATPPRGDLPPVGGTSVVGAVSGTGVGGTRAGISRGTVTREGGGAAGPRAKPPERSGRSRASQTRPRSPAIVLHGSSAPASGGRASGLRGGSASSVIADVGRGGSTAGAADPSRARPQGPRPGSKVRRSRLRTSGSPGPAPRAGHRRRSCAREGPRSRGTTTGEAQRRTRRGNGSPDRGTPWSLTYLAKRAPSQKSLRSSGNEGRTIPRPAGRAGSGGRPRPERLGRRG